MKLDGTIAIVAVPDGAALARRLVDEGATVVLTGVDAAAAGGMLADLVDGPGRVAYFAGAGAGAVDALVAFVVEQFAERPPVS